MARKYNYYQGYSGGGPSALPPGFMEAATSGARSIARGIESASKSISDAIKEKDEEEKQFNKLSKAAATGMEALDKLLPEMNVYGEGGKEAFNNLSAMEKIGMFQGAEKAQEMANKKIAARYQQTMTDQMTYKQDREKDTTAGSQQVMELMSKPSQRDIANELGLGVFADSFPMEDREQKLLNAMGQALENYPQADPNAMSQAVERLLSQQKTTRTAVPGTTVDIGSDTHTGVVVSPTGAINLVPKPGPTPGSKGYRARAIEGTDDTIVEDVATGKPVPGSSIQDPASRHPIDQLGGTSSTLFRDMARDAKKYHQSQKQLSDLEKEMQEGNYSATDKVKGSTTLWMGGETYQEQMDALQKRMSDARRNMLLYNVEPEDFDASGNRNVPGGANATGGGSGISSANFFNDPRNADRHNPNR